MKVPETLSRNPLWMRKCRGESETARIPVPLMDTVVVAGEGAEAPAATTVDAPFLGLRRVDVENGRNRCGPECGAVLCRRTETSAVVKGHYTFPSAIVTPSQPCVQIDLDSLFKYAPSGHPGDEIARIASP